MIGFDPIAQMGSVELPSGQPGTMFPPPMQMDPILGSLPNNNNNQSSMQFTGPSCGSGDGRTTGKEENEQQLTSKPKIGIIYPPLVVRNIVDKTASFVAKNGPEFEARVRLKEMGNAKFMFLNPTDPYYGYYQHKLKEFIEGRPSEPIQPPSIVQKQVIPHKIQEQVLKTQAAVLAQEPPAEFEFCIEPLSISLFDLDLVKFTAQFVARNGRKFLTGLMNREYRNPQFDFLRPQHGLFPYFTKLIEHYTKILIYPKGVAAELRSEITNPKKVLDNIEQRVEWVNHREREKLMAEEAIEREKVAYARIDWHDFVIVETVDFPANEVGDFPSPTSASEVGARILHEERQMLLPEQDKESQAEVAAVSMVLDEMEMSSGSESEDESEEEEMKPPVPLPPQPDAVVIRKHYDPKAAKSAEVQGPASLADEPVLISPITGEKIPASKITDHMRYATLDPKWAQTKEREIRERMEQEEVYAQGGNVQSELKKFAERRTDIFGEGDQETIIGKKIGEEDVRIEDKATWDGHTATMEKTSKKAMQGITIEDQINAIHKAQGLIEDELTHRIGPTVTKTVTNVSSISGSVTSLHGPVDSEHLFLKDQSKITPSKPTPSAVGTMKKMMQTSHLLMTSEENPIPAFAMLINQPSQINFSTIPMPHVAPSIPGHMPHLMTTPIMHPPPPPPPLMTPHSMAPPPIPPNICNTAITPMPPMPPRPQPAGPINLMIRPQPPLVLAPVAKKMRRTDETASEQEFIAKFGREPMPLKVEIPNVPDKRDWQLNGQILNLSIPITDTISVIKAKLTEILGLPGSKQKLQYQTTFLKDSNTLAFYSVHPNSVIQLVIKERGGKKK